MRKLKQVLVLNFVVFNLLGQTKLNDSSLSSWESAKCETLNGQTSFDCFNLKSKEAFHIVANNKEILLVNSKSKKVVEKIKLSKITTGNSSPLKKESLNWVEFKTPISLNLIGYSNNIETPLFYIIPIHKKDRISSYSVILFNSNFNSMSACN